MRARSDGCTILILSSITTIVNKQEWMGGKRSDDKFRVVFCYLNSIVACFVILIKATSPVHDPPLTTMNVHPSHSIHPFFTGILILFIYDGDVLRLWTLSFYLDECQRLKFL